MDNVELHFKFTSDNQKIMRGRGVDGSLFAGKRNSFNFEDAVVRMRPSIPYLVTKSIGTKRQTVWASSVLDQPLKNRLICVGSFPSDLRAKLFALNIMDRAITEQQRSTKDRYVRTEYPYWHKIYGGYRDPLRDGDLAIRPSMLILSNIDQESTPIKIEKLRDLLEQNTHIPRVVIVTGACPVEFFATKLHLPVDVAIYLGADNREGKVDVLDI